MTSPPLPRTPRQRLQYTADSRALGAVRAQFADLCEVLPDAGESFHAMSATLAVGPALMIESRSTSVVYDRTPLHLARSPIDHFQATLYLVGGYHVDAGRRAATVAAGDVGLVDMAQAARTHVVSEARCGEAHFLTAVLPRAALAALLPVPDAVHATVVGGRTPVGRLLRAHILGLWSGAPALAPAEAEPTVPTLAGLVARAAGWSGEADLSVAKATRAALFAAIVRHVERRLADPDLGADAICRRFGVSRASLYRMFEPHGGLMHYVQDRRMKRAFAMLVAPEHRHRRLIDIAGDCQFASDATFARAFRRHYGHAPGEIRAAALHAPARPPADGSLMGQLRALGTAA